MSGTRTEGGRADGKSFDLAAQGRICSLCPNMCRFLCPVAAVRKVETVTPRGKATLVGGLGRDETLWSEEAAGVFYNCATCKICLEWCPSGVDLVEVTRGLRERAALDGSAPGPVKALRERLVADRSLYGQASELARSLRRYREMLTPGAKVLYFAGCSTAALHPGLVGAALRLFETAGVKAAMLESEPCCGLPLDLLGYREDAATFAAGLASAVREGGFETVVSGCPMCTYVLKERYPALGVSLEVEVRHLAEVLAGPVPAAALRGAARIREAGDGPGARRRATYHDPCYLGRYQGVYDAPRSLLADVAGLGLVEMDGSGGLAACCGGAATTVTAVPDAATAIAGRRLDEAARTGVDLLVTACPHCLDMLRPAAGKASRLRVADLAEVLAERVGAFPGRGDR